MKILFLFLFSFIMLMAKDCVNCGDLLTYEDLNMNKDDYYYLCGITGLICGSIFSFAITR